MQRKLNWLMVSALAIGGVTFVTAYAQEAQQPATPTAQQPSDQTLGQPGTLSSDAQKAGAQATAELSLPAGAKVTNANADAKELADVIENATEAATEKGEFDDVVNTLVDQDRNRLGDWKNFDFKTLDGRIDQVRRQFKEKYGDDDIEIDSDKVFADGKAVTGEIEDPATFVQNWPVKASMAAEAQTAAAGAGQVKTEEAAPAGAKTVDDETRTQGNIEKGRNIAVLRLPAKGDSPEITVSLIRELTGWKMDIPNNRSLQMVHDDLLEHLTHVSDNAASWPADKDEAKALISRHVVLGLYGIEMPQRKS